MEIQKDQYGNEKSILWLKKDKENKEYYCIDENVIQMIPLISSNNILFYTIDENQFEHLGKMKNILINFAKNIDIINMNDIPMQKTIELMKNKDQLQEKVVQFIKNADLYMDNFEFVDMNQIKIDVHSENNVPDENVLNVKEQIMDQMRLVSTYKGVKVPSMLFDSTGTKKLPH